MNEESLHAAIKPMCSDGIEKKGELIAPPLGICRANSCNNVSIVTAALRYMCFVNSHAEWQARKTSTVTRSEQVDLYCWNRGQSMLASLFGIMFCDAYGVVIFAVLQARQFSPVAASGTLR